MDNEFRSDAVRSFLDLQPHCEIGEHGIESYMIMIIRILEQLPLVIKL